MSLQEPNWAARGAERAGGAPAPGAPYVSIQEHNNPSQGSRVAASRAKAVYRWRIDMENFIEEWGIDNIGFVTLGFPDPQPTADEAEARFNSAMTNYGPFVPYHLQSPPIVRYDALAHARPDDPF